MGRTKPGGFLEHAYDLASGDATRALYRSWAQSYEREVRENGYVTPARCAAALASRAVERDAPLLDLGCGTGLSGEALRAAGFTTIDGTDFCEDMLEHARTKRGIYRTLVLGDLANPIPVAPGRYANAAAVGVFSPGHAPAAMMDDVLDRLPRGGCFVFSLNDHALAEPAYRERIDAIAAAGLGEVVFHEYGDHLPGAGLKASVYVLRRC